MCSTVSRRRTVDSQLLSVEVQPGSHKARFNECHCNLELCFRSYFYSQGLLLLWVLALEEFCVAHLSLAQKILNAWEGKSLELGV